MTARQRLSTLLAVFGGLLWLGVPLGAFTWPCGSEDPYDVFFADGESTSPPGVNCTHDFTRCYEAVTLAGPWIRLKDPGCDPTAGPCVLQVGVELEFPGTEENIDDISNYSPWIYWYDEASPNEACEPRFDPGCGQIGTCGVFGASASIETDTAETWVEIPGVSCQDTSSSQLQTYSLTGFSCGTNRCVKKHHVEGISATPEAVKAALGCPDPPKQECNGDAACNVCMVGGVGAGGGPPGFGGPGDPPTGPGARLRYAGGGVGHPQFPGTAEHVVTLGRYWSHDYAERIVADPDESHVWLLTRYGSFREWSSPDVSGVYTVVAPSTEKRTLTFLGAGAGWELRGLRGTVDLFDDSGRWISRTDRNGNAKVATYGAGGELQSVDFPDGRREDFFYHASGKLASITEVGVDGLTERVWSYTWTGDDLTRIDRPDGTALLFHYADPAHPGFLTRMELEGTDGTSVRVLRGYEYDAEGNVTSTWKGDAAPAGPDAVERWSFAYDDPEHPTVTTATPPVGDPVTYQLGRDTVSSNVKVLEISGDCPVCGLGPNAQIVYDDAANPMLPTEIVDARGTVTSFTYDAFGQTTSRTEADGEAGLQRTTFWTYDPTFPALVTSMEQPSVAGGAATRTTDWVRDASGNATSRTISGVEAGSGFALTTTTTYNAAGQPLTVDPPGHGTADETTFTYDPARGSLVADSRTDPLVGTTTFGHDPFHRRTSVLDPNGVETETAHDPLDRVTEIRQVGASPPTDDLVTTQEYNAFGDLLRTTLPEGNVIEYGHDAAGRLISVERKPDAATPGERVLYQLDEAGNRTLEEHQRWDAGASAWVTLSATEYDYTNRCRVDRIVQAPDSPEQAVTEFIYDCNGNLIEQWDPNHDAATDLPTTSYMYDALDRLTEVSQPWAGGGLATTSYSYDVANHLTSVTDAEGNVTTYEYSDRDLLTQEVSPVSGTTIHGYDDHGALVETTDARGITVLRTVDELDRVTFVDYPDDSLDTTYAYDTAPAICGTSFPVGRLASISRNGQAVESCFDRFGRTTRDGELTYTWDGNGNRIGIGYPGNVSAEYGFDFADREVALEVTTPGGVENVVQAASYLPSGPLSTLALGSGTTEIRAFDGRYAPTSIALTGPTERTFTYTTDRVGNVLGITEHGGCTPGPIVLESQTVITEETVTSCTTIEAGNGYSIESPGDVTFNAQGSVILKDGFSVGSGASFTAGSGELPPLSVRSYSYQAPQYFLTSADGPWGTLDWTYDRIGNRLSETRDGGNSDTYQYLTNGGGGNTPILDLISLGVGGTRAYTWGAAGHLEEVAAGANVIDFASDAEGRLQSTTRAVAEVSASYSYDGRSFLAQAMETTGDPPAEAASVESVYDSGGLVHALRRRASPSDPEEVVVFFYFAGRPVGQVAIDGGGGETWAYFTTDHLGTPLLATDDAGGVTWEGGLEPFGRDYQAGTPAGTLENGIYLRLPGQLQETSWANATSGAGIYYNVHRWYAPGLGRYSKPDPAGLGAGVNLYNYAESNPILYFDPLGEKVCRCDRRLANPLAAITLRRDPLAHHTYVQIVPDGRECGGYDGLAWGFQAAGGGRVLPENTPVFNPQIQCEEIPCIDERKLVENIVRDMKAPPFRYEAVCRIGRGWNDRNCQGWADDVLDRSRTQPCCE